MLTIDRNTVVKLPSNEEKRQAVLDKLKPHALKFDGEVNMTIWSTEDTVGFFRGDFGYWWAESEMTIINADQFLREELTFKGVK